MNNTTIKVYGNSVDLKTLPKEKLIKGINAVLELWSLTGGNRESPFVSDAFYNTMDWLLETEQATIENGRLVSK